MSAQETTMILRKLADIQYLRSVILKYLLEALLITFAFYWVVHKGGTGSRVPKIENVVKVFVWVVVMFTMMDILAPQAITNEIPVLTYLQLPTWLPFPWTKISCCNFFFFSYC